MDIKGNQKKQQPKEENSKKLLEDLEKYKKDAEEYKNKYLRALADYQNYEKRVQGEKTQIEKRSMQLVILKLLPFLDNLEKAEVFFKDPGLKMIKDSFGKMLAEMGLQEIKILNSEYDPHLAEAVEVVQGDKDNIVTEVLRKGYMFGDIILRVAQVKVSKKIPN